MTPIGRPMTVQNTDTNVWLVQIPDVITSTSGESVSLVVNVRRDPTLTLQQVQDKAVDRAIELLQLFRAPRHPD